MKKIHLSLALALLVIIGLSWMGCFRSSGDDDDDKAIINCDPTACDSIQNEQDCEAYADQPDVAMACSYCLSGTITDAQIAQCIMSNLDQATGESLRNGCIKLTTEQCMLATTDDDDDNDVSP